MKILNIFDALEFSGAEQMFLDSYSDFKKKGFRNEILITKNYKGKAIREFLKKKVIINQVKFTDKFIWKYIINILSLFKLISLIRSNKYDCVVINTERNFFSYLFVSKYLLNIKTIRIVHNNFSFDYLLKIRRKIFVYFANKIGVKFVSVSNCVKKNELKNYNNKSKVLLNFINFNKNKIKNKNTNKYKIFTVGNCSSVKQHDFLLNALSLLPHNLNWEYLHFGKEEKYNPEQILAKKLNIFNKCKFYGPTSYWRHYINSNSIFINCSSREGLSIATLEAIDLGCIPIISNVAGNKTIKKYLKNVITFNNSIKDFNEKLLKIIMLGELQKSKIRKKITSDLRKNFNKLNYLEEYQKIINT